MLISPISLKHWPCCPPAPCSPVTLPQVLLDENLLESMPTSPIFVGKKAKQLLERAVWNDTAFLAVSSEPVSE